MYPFKNHYLVEIPLTSIAAGQRYFINDIPQLRNKKIVAIESHSRATLAVSPILAPVVLPAGIVDAMCTFSVQTMISGTKTVGKNVEQIYQIPYFSMYRPGNNGYMMRFNMLRMDMSKSFIQLTSVLNITAGDSLLLGVFYE